MMRVPMAALRTWIVTLAAACFGSGAFLGHVVSNAAAAGLEVPENDRLLEAQMTSDYGLDARQQHRLRLVLQHAREQESAIWASAQESQLPKPLMSRLLRARNQTEQRIRALLDDEQRARYDRESRPPGRRAEAPAGTPAGANDGR
jgi:hypothetical protein